MKGNSSIGGGGPIDHDDSSDSDGPLTRGRVAIIAAIALFGLLAVSGALPVQFGGLTGGDDGGVNIDNVEITEQQVSEGDQFTVEVTVINTANESTTDEIQVDVGDLGTETVEVNIPAEETAAVEAEFGTEAGDAGEYTVAVSSSDDSVETPLEVARNVPEVTIDSVNAPSSVFAGQTLTVTANVTNEGDSTWSGEIVLLNDTNDPVDTIDVSSVAPGNTEQVELEWDVDEDADEGDREVRVNVTAATRVIASATTPVEIKPIDGATFRVKSLDAQEQVSAGGEFEVTVEVENIGDEFDAQGLSVDAGALGDQSVLLNLEPGDSTEETFTFQTESAGEYTITASTDDEEATTTVTVEEAASASVSQPDIADEGSEATVAQGEGGTIAVDVTNDGDQSSQFEASLSIDGTPETTSTVSVGPGETGTVEFDIPTDLGTGTYDITISVAGETATGTLDVTQQAASALSGLDIAGQGDDATVTLPSNQGIAVTVQNVGGVSDSFTVNLAVGDTTEQTVTNELAGGETETVTFEGILGGLEPGAYDVTVSTDNDEVTGTVDIQQPEGAVFQVQSTGAQSGEIESGDTVTLSATIENIGSENGTQTVGLEVLTAAGITREKTLTLGSGESDTVAFDVQIEETGQHQYFFDTEDDEKGGSVTVESKSPFFVVTSVSTNAPITENETLEVTVDLSNTGDEEGTKTLTVDGGGLGSNSTDVSIPGGDSTTETLTLDTEQGENGTYSLAVETEDDDETTSVTVDASEDDGGDGGDGGDSESANFEVEITDVGASSGSSSGALTPAQDGATVVAGQGINVVVEVTNTGSVEGTQTINLLVDASGQDPLGTDDVTVSLASGESKLKGLTVSTDPTDEPGAYTAEVSSENDTASASIQLEKPSGEFSVEITETNSPVAGEDLEVTVEVTNTGDVQASPTVNLMTGVGDTSADISSLEPGATVSETLSVSTAEGDGGTIDVTATVGDVTDSTTVEVAELAAEFLVDITEINNPVAGEDLEVDVTVTNNGTQSGVPSIELTTNPDIGTAEKSTNSPIEPGETRDATLSVSTQQGDAGTQYTAIVATVDDQDSKTFDVLEDAFFDVSITEIPEEVEVGEELEVDAEVNNTGDAAATQTISLLVDDTTKDSTTVEDLSGADDPVDVTLTADTSGTDPGTELSVQVTTSGDGESSETKTVTVTESSSPGTAETGIGSAVNESQSGPVWSPVGGTPASQESPVRVTARADATAAMRQYR